MSPILTKPKREKKLPSRKIRFIRNSNNQTSVFEVSTVDTCGLINILHLVETSAMLLISF